MCHNFLFFTHFALYSFRIIRFMSTKCKCLMVIIYLDRLFFCRNKMNRLITLKLSLNSFMGNHLSANVIVMKERIMEMGVFTHSLIINGIHFI